jgi:hypothetical protein
VSARDHGVRASITAAALAALALVLPSAALILGGNNSGRAAFDSTAYHERFIRALAESFPAFDLTNPLTATTPGYHIVVATLAQLGADSTTAMRLVSMLIGAAFVGCVAAWLARRVGAALGVVFTLPLVASIYVLGSAAWLLPDNLAWLLVVSILFLALGEPARARRLALASVLLVLLVCVRQIHIWAAATVWIGGWMLVVGGARPARGLVDRTYRTLPWVLATVPAFGALVMFVRHWGGLTPPRFQNELQGVNPATPAFILLQVAVISAAFFPWLAGPVQRAWRQQRGAVLVAALLGMVAALIPATTADLHAGRFSGWWGVIERAPVIGGRTSLLVLLCAPIGAIVLASALLGLHARARAVLGVSFLAFVAALTANYYCWQRYHEPFILVLVPMLCVLQQQGTPRATGWRMLAPLAFAAMLAVISARGFRGDPVPPDALPAPEHVAPEDPFVARR